MICEFGEFRIDLLRQELLRDGSVVDVEPLAFQLIALLAKNQDRLVTKDELFATLWGNRIVSEAALSTCIKSARRAVEDTGDRQAVIKTVHGKGLRWMAPLQIIDCEATPASVVPQDLDVQDTEWIEAATRPTIAILPFDNIGADGTAKTLSAAIPHELIASISRLRWIAVIARGSSFRFHSKSGEIGEIRKSLGARYCLTGSVEVMGPRVAISVMLSSTADGEVIWADRFNSRLDDVHEVREQIISHVVFAIEVQIPLSEASKARLRSPENIDAWATYHLGLQSLYRFDANENDRAIALFEKAIALEPEFARAHGALSFAHFKTAFMHYSDSPAEPIKLARAEAERAVDLDPMDPFANFNMGRALWLVGDLNSAKIWLDRSTALSPNFAQGIYARAWTETVSGASGIGRRLSDEARALSPLDPLLYAMLGTRAMSLAMEGRDSEAADWAVRAANAPGAHDLISLIATFTNELAGNQTEAAQWADRVRASRQRITQDHFFRSFPFTDPDTRSRFSSALTRQGIPQI